MKGVPFSCRCTPSPIAGAVAQSSLGACIAPALLSTDATLKKAGGVMTKPPRPKRWLTHINFQELLASRTGIKKVSGEPSLHKTRLLTLLDSQVVACTVQKRRSTSHKLNAFLQTIAGTCLLVKLDPVLLWISSAANAADDPTRLSHVREAKDADEVSEGFWATAEDWSWALSWPLAATISEWKQGV
eukprot:3337353-Amphidinium_carterae.1